MSIELLISGLDFPEGPSFDNEGNLWFVEIKGGNLVRFDGEKVECFPVDGTPNGTAIDKNGLVWFCDSGRGEIRQFNPMTKEFNTLCSTTDDGEQLKRPNDLIFDSQGNLLFSDHADGREDPASTICVLPKGENIAEVISRGKFFTNGLALSDKGRILVFAETYNQQLWMGEWDFNNLQLVKERPFAKAGRGPWGPDGIAYDENENLYVTIFNESKINIYDKEGNLFESLKTPGNRPTSCAFDPFGRYGLVVTEAERGELLSFHLLQKGLPVF